MADAPGGSELNRTNLTDDECKEFHAYFMKGATFFGAVALVAHFLTFAWKPWFPGV